MASPPSSFGPTSSRAAWCPELCRRGGLLSPTRDVIAASLDIRLKRWQLRHCWNGQRDREPAIEAGEMTQSWNSRRSRSSRKVHRVRIECQRSLCSNALQSPRNIPRMLHLAGTSRDLDQPSPANRVREATSRSCPSTTFAPQRPKQPSLPKAINNVIWGYRGE